MKVSRLVLRTIIALVCVALAPWVGGTQELLLWDWCIKLGDYYDTGGTGYHVIYCHGEYTGDAFYYIPHGTPFIIQQV